MSNFEPQYLATLQHARRRLDQRVEHARKRIADIDAQLPRLTARFQQQDKKLMQRERDELVRLLDDVESGAAHARVEADLLPFRQAYVEITRETDQRLVAAAVQELKLCADPESMQTVMTDRRSKRMRVPTVDAAMRRARSAASMNAASEPLFRESMGAKTTGKRALHDVLHTVSAIIDATPSLPPVIEHLSAPATDVALRDAVQAHTLFLQRAPSGYVPPTSAETEAMTTTDEQTKRTRIKERAASIIEAAYNIENINSEMARMRGDFENAVFVVNKDICESCHKPMVVIAEACLAVCPLCKRARTYIQTSAVVRNTMNRGPDGGKLRRNTKSGVFDEFFNRWMGLGKKVEDGVVEALRHAMVAIGVRVREQVSMCLVHFMLESLNAEKIMQMKVQIYCRLTGAFPPRMTKDQQSLINSMRRAVVVPWDAMMARTGRKRVNSLCEFILFKIIQLLGWSHLSEYFTLLTCASSERYLMVCDEIWRGVCAAYNWEYIPTVLSIPMCAEYLHVRNEDVTRVLMETYGGAPQPPTYTLSKIITRTCNRRVTNHATHRDTKSRQQQSPDTHDALETRHAFHRWNDFEDAPQSGIDAPQPDAADREQTKFPARTDDLAGLTPPQRIGLMTFVRALEGRIDASTLSMRSDVIDITNSTNNIYLFSDTIEVVRKKIQNVSV